MRPHGLKGEVTISLDVDAPADWDSLKSIFLEVKSQLVPYFIETISVRHDKAFLKLEDVSTPEASCIKRCFHLLAESKPAKISARRLL
jgi:16S rRNA processing protein RimM